MLGCWDIKPAAAAAGNASAAVLSKPTPGDPSLLWFYSAAVDLITSP